MVNGEKDTPRNSREDQSVVRAASSPGVRASPKYLGISFLSKGGNDDAIFKLYLSSTVECDRDEQNQQVG